MSQYEYRTIPFAGKTQESDKTPGRTLAAQLEHLINTSVGKGWEFYRVDHLTIVIKNGCLAALSGNPYSTRTYDVVIFRRPV
jgi:hypothetical protein